MPQFCEGLESDVTISPAVAVAVLEGVSRRSFQCRSGSATTGAAIQGSRAIASRRRSAAGSGGAPGAAYTRTP